MKSFLRWSRPVAAGLVLLAGAALAPAQNNPQPVKLDQGMAAAEIIKLLGKPAEVVPLKNTGDKGERWLYRQPLRRAPGPDGKPSAVTGYQVLTLLMIEGKLVVARQTIEETPPGGK